MVDANQVWEVEEAITWMKQLSEFNLTWIEEPTSPDDVLGHARIAKALKPLKIGVATGEMCCNRVLFKQFLQAEALEYLQIDSARIGGINEILSVYLMAHKFGGVCHLKQFLLKVYRFFLQSRCVRMPAASACAKWCNTCKCGTLFAYLGPIRTDLLNTWISSTNIL